MPGNLTRSLILVLGGARSGKSRYAQQLADRLWKYPLFLATAEILDDEMADRVKEHQKARGSHWGCIEEPLDIDRIIRENPSGADGILIDCITIWLSNVLTKEGIKAFERRKDDLFKALRTAGEDVILVSNEVGMGIVPENKLGRTFRDLAGWLNQSLAAEVDIVVFVAAGLAMPLKGRLPDVTK